MKTTTECRTWALILLFIFLFTASVEAKIRKWVDSSGVMHIGNAPLPPAVEDLNNKAREFCRKNYSLPNGSLKYDMYVWQDDRDIVILKCTIPNYYDDWEKENLRERKDHLVNVFSMFNLWNRPYKYKIRYEVYRGYSSYLLGEIGYFSEPHQRGYSVDTPIIYSGLSNWVYHVGDAFGSWSLIWENKKGRESLIVFIPPEGEGNRFISKKGKVWLIDPNKVSNLDSGMINFVVRSGKLLIISEY